MLDGKVTAAYAVLVLLLFACGAAFGSLLGALIERFPRGIGLCYPRSFCLCCSKQLAWYDLVPVFSYLALRGRCRHCHAEIPPTLLLLEMVCGLLLCLLVARWGNSLCTLQLFVLCWLLLGIAYLDAQTGWIPLHLLALLLMSGLGFAALSHAGLGSDEMCVLSASLWQRLAASAGALVMLGAVLIVSTRLLRYLQRIGPQQSAMGWGDPLLLAGIGAHVGLLWLPMIVLLASVQSIVFHLFYRATNRRWMFTQWHDEKGEETVAKHAIPFGPFLAAATWQTIAISLTWPTL